MIALAVYRGAVNLRPSPSTDSVPLLKTQAPDFARLLGITRLDADPLPWLHVEMDDGTQGYTRADVSYVVGDLTLVGGAKLTDVTLATAALTVTTPPPVPVPVPPASGTTAGKWGTPVSPYLITEPFEGPGGHLGIDLAGVAGSPVYARGKGIVYEVTDCPHCPGTAHNGSVMGTSDPLTAYGFGLSVVTRHSYADLNASGKAALDAVGLRDGYLFVRVAHLSSRSVGAGVTVSDGTQLGLRGTSGNSSGPHVHCECRASKNASPVNVFAETLVDPNTVFAL